MSAMSDMIPKGRRMATSLCPKKVHWAVTDQQKLIKRSKIGLQCFYFTSISVQVQYYSNRSATWIAFTKQIKQSKKFSVTMDFFIGMLNPSPYPQVKAFLQ